MMLWENYTIFFVFISVLSKSTRFIIYGTVFLVPVGLFFAGVENGKGCRGEGSFL